MSLPSCPLKGHSKTDQFNEASVALWSVPGKSKTVILINKQHNVHVINGLNVTVQDLHTHTHT